MIFFTAVLLKVPLLAAFQLHEYMVNSLTILSSILLHLVFL